VSLLAIPMYTMSPKELAPTEDEGVIFGIIDASADSTVDQTSRFTAAVNQAYLSVPETQFTFQITRPNSGFAGMVVQPWGERKRNIFQILPRFSRRCAPSPAFDAAGAAAGAAGGGQFPVEFILASTADSEQLLQFAAKSSSRRCRAVCSPSRRSSMSKSTSRSRKSSSIATRRPNSGLTAAGRVRHGGHGGRNFVNRFDISGRSYKSSLRSSAWTGSIRTNSKTSMSPARRAAGAAQHHRHLRNSTVPRSLNRFQQLNAVKISGVSVRPLDEALRFLEDEAAKILPKGYVIDYTGESRQLRSEGNRFLYTFALAVILIFLVLAAQFNSFRDPFVILAGSVPLAMFGALVFTFLRMPDPNVKFWTHGWTTTLNIYSQIGLVTLVGLVSKNGILIVEFANKLQLQGHAKREAVRQRPSPVCGRSS